MSKKVIITADDYGYIDLIDTAILGAAKNHRITTVSAFSNLNKVPLDQKITALKNTNANIGIGLHLTITSGMPLSQPKYLSKEKDGKLYFKSPKNIVLKKIPLEEVEIELKAQISQMRSILGNQIDHISCHHNILYLNPDLFDLYIKLAKAENLPIRAPRNCISKPKFSPIKNLNPALIPPYIEDAFGVMNARNIIPALVAVSENNVKSQENQLFVENVDSPNFFLIHHYGNQDINIFKTMYDILEENEVCEQIMHLGRATDPEDFNDFPNGINKGYLEDRHKEFLLLMSNEFLNLKNGQNDITFSKYS